MLIKLAPLAEKAATRVENPLPVGTVNIQEVDGVQCFIVVQPVPEDFQVIEKKRKLKDGTEKVSRVIYGMSHDGQNNKVDLGFGVADANGDEIRVSYVISSVPAVEETKDETADETDETTNGEA